MTPEIWRSLADDEQTKTKRWETWKALTPDTRLPDMIQRAKEADIATTESLHRGAGQTAAVVAEANQAAGTIASKSKPTTKARQPGAPPPAVGGSGGSVAAPSTQGEERSIAASKALAAQEKRRKVQVKADRLFAQQISKIRTSIEEPQNY